VKEGRYIVKEGRYIEQTKFGWCEKNCSSSKILAKQQNMKIPS